MKLLRRPARTGLPERLDALAAAVEDGQGRLPAEVLERARGVVERAGQRRRLSTDHTVVALAGATGSGKSSIFNALAGIELARVGVRRPTTASHWRAFGAPRASHHARMAGHSASAPNPRRAFSTRARTTRSTAWCCWTCQTTTRPSDPSRSGRPAGGDGRPVRLGPRPAEVRRCRLHEGYPAAVVGTCRPSR